ncbi:glucose-6-phosphate dehydrogenase (NADP(+)) [Candidatus Saccharibacteria bacterium]|nr:glucose-6-phosphate dehydrogenase (NADP(+)) [Candidatus Saccharibacteria bacterium]
MKTKLVIFGISGDLGRRKLLPAIEQIIKSGGFDDLSVIGVSRHEVDLETLFEKCEDKHFLDGKLSIYSMDPGEINGYAGLKEHVNLGDNEQLLIHMAVPPLVTTQIVEFLGQSGLNTPNVKILFEKPFGVDFESAEKLIKQTEIYFKEEQVYRIDHYLAKEMAQNVVAFRGRNALFNDIWDNRFIESIEVLGLQKINIEGRGHFYEQTGALRDFVQGHLMQLLSLVLMRVPDNFEWDKMPGLRLEAIRQISHAEPGRAVRGQYDGYKQEVGNPDSKVETFVSVKLLSNQPEWLGVPITLTSGKAMSETKTEISVKIRSNDGAKSNRLIFKVQPDEGIEIQLYVKKPGYGQEFEAQTLKFNYPDGSKLPDAYEQVIVDAIQSQKSLFTSSDEVMQSWRILQPLLDDWRASSASPRLYLKGSDLSSLLA